MSQCDNNSGANHNHLLIEEVSWNQYTLYRYIPIDTMKRVPITCDKRKK